MTQKPLTQRLAGLPPSPEDSPLSMASFSIPFQAAAMVTESEYPLWLRDRLMSYYRVPGNVEYDRMVSHACRLIRKFGEKADYDLLYLLTIEPIHLINTAKEAK